MAIPHSAILAADTAASQTDVWVAIVVALVGALATTVVGLLNFRTQRQTLNWQRRQQGAQLELMMSAQITDRFTKAIDQIGSNITAVRIGGVYALEQIGRDSEQHRRYIISTLATFVREAQPAAAVQGQSHVPMLKVRAPDVQAALDVLCRAPLSEERRTSTDSDLLDLSRTDLRRASLSGAHLERANLWGARLDGANLQRAHLQGAVLSSANLGRFEAGNSRYLAGADLSGADLTGARLDDVINLHEAKTSGDTRGLPTLNP